MGQAKGTRDTPRVSRARGIGIHMAVLASYALIALIHLRPLAFRFAETLPRGERVDVLLHGWIINWTARQLARAPWELFQANIFFPHQDTLAYTEHMVPEALPVVPIRALTGDPVLTYNVAYLLTFVLGGWGTFLLLRRLTGNPWAAWLGGVFACYFPAKRWSLAHINTISVHGVPFAMLALHRLLERPGAGRAVLAGIAITWASLMSAYYAVYLPLLLGLAVPLIWWADARPLDRPRIQWMAVAAAVAVATTLPLLTPYLGTWAGGDEPVRSYDLQVAGASDVAEWFILDSVAWERLLLPAQESLGPLTTPLFPGAVAVLLMLAALFGRRTPARVAGDPPRQIALVGGFAAALAFLVVLAGHLVRHHRETAALRPGPEAPAALLLVLAVAAPVLLGIAVRGSFDAFGKAVAARFVASPRMARVYAATGALALLLALGPRLKFFGYEGPPLPYALVYEWMPGASALRAPYRAAILGQAFFAVVIGLGAALVLARLRRRGWSDALPAVALAALMVLETTGRPLALENIPQPDNAVYAWLAGQPGEFGILEWPIARLMDDTAPGQWLSTYHWKHRVTGHNGRLPEDIRELHPLARRWPPGPEFFEMLRERFPVRYVIVDLNRFVPETQRELTMSILPGLSQWLEPEQSFDNKRVYRLRNGGSGELRRRFAGWMPRGELVVQLAEPIPLDGEWHLEAELDPGVALGDPDPAPAGAVELRVVLPDGLTTDGPVWLRLAVRGPGDRLLDVARIRFETPEGIVYP